MSLTDVIQNNYSFETVSSLLKTGTHSLTIPLIMATSKGYDSCVKLLLKYKANVNEECNDRFPIDGSTYHDKYSTTKLLLEKGAVPTTESLVNSIDNNNLKMCSLLIEHKASVNSTVRIFDTPLSYALREKRFFIASLLIKNGADVNQVKTHMFPGGIVGFIRSVPNLIENCKRPDIQKLAVCNGLKLKPNSLLQKYKKEQTKTILSTVYKKCKKSKIFEKNISRIILDFLK